MTSKPQVNFLKYVVGLSVNTEKYKNNTEP